MTGLVFGCGLAAVVFQHAPGIPGGRLGRGVFCLATYVAVWSAVAVWYFRKKRGAV